MDVKKEKNLISIGAFSRLTGANIKSLRYYDDIGVLRPAYVDEESGYRYYSFTQFDIVEAIHLCIELNIPLKSFCNYVDEAGRLKYSELISDGRRLALKKIRKIKDDLDYLGDIKMLIDRSNRYERIGSFEFNVAEKFFWTSPFGGVQTDAEFYAEISRMGENIMDAGLGFRHEIGLMLTESGRYAYLEVTATAEQAAAYPQITRTPAGKYRGVRSEKSDVGAAFRYFPELERSEENFFVFETELVTESCDFSSPVYELRYFTGGPAK